MDNHLAEAATADLLVRVGWQVGGVVFALVVGVIGTLLWGKGGRKRLVESTKTLMDDNKRLSKRVTALEAQNRIPSITQTIHFDGATSANERERHLRSAIDTETVHGLRETIRCLPQEPLGDGRTYAKLPDGTNIVSMADGGYRLALPVRMQSALGSTGVGGASLTPPREADAYERWKLSPGAGRNAAKAIAKAATLEEAREIWAAFYSASRRMDMNWAFWAFIARLEEAGEGQEVYSLSFDLHGGEEDLDPTDEIKAAINRWWSEDDPNSV